jgi:hypothetical protein
MNEEENLNGDEAEIEKRSYEAAIQILEAESCSVEIAVQGEGDGIFMRIEGGNNEPINVLRTLLQAVAQMGLEAGIEPDIIGYTAGSTLQLLVPGVVRCGIDATH